MNNRPSIIVQYMTGSPIQARSQIRDIRLTVVEIHRTRSFDKLGRHSNQGERILLVNGFVACPILSSYQNYPVNSQGTKLGKLVAVFNYFNCKNIYWP